jgi:hypothetical protein
VRREKLTESILRQTRHRRRPRLQSRNRRRICLMLPFQRIDLIAELLILFPQLNIRRAGT